MDNLIVQIDSVEHTDVERRHLERDFGCCMVSDFIGVVSCILRGGGVEVVASRLQVVEDIARGATANETTV